MLKLNHLKLEFQNIWYSNVFSIPMFCIQAPTVPNIQPIEVDCSSDQLKSAQIEEQE